uniref:Uncharacterized protein n=1 Tax=Acrobeloides nanus TaxID=290746 RepID=A0A914EB93_9BILA
MKGTLSFIFILIIQISLDVVHAYPHVLLLPEPTQNSLRPTPTKRAFDRLDMSPFDFGAMAKRYVFENSDDDSLDRRKKAFDRLDESAFGFGLDRRKKAFDRLDESAFGFGLDRRKKAFDRLDESSFGFHTFKKRAFDRIDNGPFGFHKRSSAQQSTIDTTRAKRPFDRLDDSAFGLYKRSISEIAQEPNLTQFLY